MRIISLISAAVAAAAVLSVGAVVEAPHANATRGAGVVSVAADTATPAPTSSAASGDGNDPWD